MQHGNHLGCSAIDVWCWRATSRLLSEALQLPCAPLRLVIPERASLFDGAFGAVQTPLDCRQRAFHNACGSGQLHAAHAP